MDIYSNESRFDSSGNGQRCFGVIAQNIHPKRARVTYFDFVSDSSNSSDRLNRDVSRIERLITEILHNKAVDAIRCQDFRFLQGLIANCLHTTAIKWRTRQGQQMQTADYRIPHL